MRRRSLKVVALGVVVGATLVTPAASAGGGPNPGVQQGWDGISNGAGGGATRTIASSPVISMCGGAGRVAATSAGLIGRVY